MTKLIFADDIYTDTRYQRDPKPQTISRIRKNFDPRLLGLPCVSMRVDGSYWVLDGQHRVAAVKAKYGNVQIECEVLLLGNVREEAEIFRDRNQLRKATTPMEVFRSGLIAGNKECLDVYECLKKHGYTTRWSGKDKGEWFEIINCSALFRIYRSGGCPALSLTLDAVKKAWAGDLRATRAETMKGMYQFLRGFEGKPAFDLDMVMLRLASKGLSAVIDEVNLLNECYRRSETTWAAAIQRVYNKGLRLNKLYLEDR